MAVPFRVDWKRGALLMCSPPLLPVLKPGYATRFTAIRRGIADAGWKKTLSQRMVDAVRSLVFFLIVSQLSIMYASHDPTCVLGL